MSASQPTIADEIERYLRTGAADMDGWAWPGDFMERCRRQHADLRGELVNEVRRLAKGCTHEPVPEDVGVAFTRAKGRADGARAVLEDRANARNGWKVILARCAPTTKPRSALQVAREAVARDLADGA